MLKEGQIGFILKSSKASKEVRNLDLHTISDFILTLLNAILCDFRFHISCTNFLPQVFSELYFLYVLFAFAMVNWFWCQYLQRCRALFDLYEMKNSGGSRLTAEDHYNIQRLADVNVQRNALIAEADGVGASLGAASEGSNAAAASASSSSDSNGKTDGFIADLSSKLEKKMLIDCFIALVLVIVCPIVFNIILGHERPMGQVMSVRSM
jgi:hypothetical protein